MTMLAVDVGGTRIKLALMRDQSLVALEHLEARSHEGLAPQLPRIQQTCEALCARVGIRTRDCSALGMAFPSVIDATSGRIRAAYGKYDDAPHLDLTTWAREVLGLPLLIENDARMALLGEWQTGAGRGSDNLVMLTLGTGLGTAVLLQGTLLRGIHGQAGILGGHFTVRQRGASCACGNSGCAEAEASTLVVPQLARQHEQFANSALRESKVIDYETVLLLASSGDLCAISLREHALEIWSSVIVNLIHAYDPERVIIGGGILAGAAHFLPDLAEYVRRRAHTPWGLVTVVASELGDSAALFGCEALARVRLAGWL